MKKHTRKLVIFGSIIIVSGLFIIAARNITPPSSSKSTVINVIASENFWGNLLSQIGGQKVLVNSIVSDPNADPHEYETNNADARDFAKASYIVLNGAGYDSWGNKLVAANPNPNRKVFIVADYLGKHNGDNPHFWYSPTYVNSVVKQMGLDLSKIDPKDSSYFQQNLTKLQLELSDYQGRISTIKQNYSGVKVSATEDIFQYLADAAGLNLISPQTFIQAVAEGNDPPTSSVVAFQNQLQNNQSKLLVYNVQTVTPLTNNMKKLAINQNMPIVGISETIQPRGTTFQDWMNQQVTDLQNALTESMVR